MSLENLLAINRLLRHLATPESIQKLIDAAARNLVDALATNISVENRFDAAPAGAVARVIIASDARC